MNRDKIIALITKVGLMRKHGLSHSSGCASTEGDSFAPMRCDCGVLRRWQDVCQAHERASSSLALEQAHERPESELSS